MANYTRQQLRDGVIPSNDIESGNTTFILENNASSTSYFVIEGTPYYYSSSFHEGFTNRSIFNSSSIDSLVNGIIVTGSKHAGVIVLPKGSINGTVDVSGSLRVERDVLLTSIIGDVSASNKILSDSDLKKCLIDFEGENGETYPNISSSNANLTASFLMTDISPGGKGPEDLFLVGLRGVSSSLNVGDIINFSSGDFYANFLLTEEALGYTNVSASNANVTASIYLRDSNTLGSIRITNSEGGYSTGDTITFPSQSLGAINGDGENLNIELQSDDLVTDGTASFVMVTSTTIPSSHIKFKAANSHVYNINDSTSSGSYFGVNLSY